MTCIPSFQIAVPYYKGNFELKSQTNRRKKFTPQEDETLKLLIYQTGSYNWKNISEYMPGRSAKQCRDRYFNYLSEDITSEPWRKEEDQILLTYLTYIGPKWVEIARHIPGRSGNNVKNRWHKHLCKIYSYSPGKIYNIQSSSENTEKKESTLTENKSEDEEKLENIEKKYSISSLLI